MQANLFNLVKLANSSEELDKVIALSNFDITAYNTTSILDHKSIQNISGTSIAKLIQFVSNSSELDKLISLFNFSTSLLDPMPVESTIKLCNNLFCLRPASIAILTHYCDSIHNFNFAILDPLREAIIYQQQRGDSFAEFDDALNHIDELIPRRDQNFNSLSRPGVNI